MYSGKSLPILPQPALRSYLQQTLISSQVKSTMLLTITLAKSSVSFHAIQFSINHFYHTTVPKACDVLNKPVI